MLGNLFYRGVSPEQLQAMTWHELKYFEDWHRRIAEEEKRVADA